VHACVCAAVRVCVSTWGAWAHEGVACVHVQVLSAYFFCHKEHWSSSNLGACLSSLVVWVGWGSPGLQGRRGSTGAGWLLSQEGDAGSKGMVGWGSPGLQGRRGSTGAGWLLSQEGDAGSEGVVGAGREGGRRKGEKGSWIQWPEVDLLCTHIRDCAHAHVHGDSHAGTSAQTCVTSHTASPSAACTHIRMPRAATRAATFGRRA